VTEKDKWQWQKQGTAWMGIGVYHNSKTTNKRVKGMETANDGYPFPIFTERPFIRPLSRRGQLDTMIRYIKMNPQRLAPKQTKH